MLFLTLSNTNYFNAFKWLFITFLFLFFFIGGPSHYSSLGVILFWNNGHIIFYFITSLLLLKKAISKYSLQISIILVFIYTLILGGVIEVIQNNIGRGLDYADMYRNLLGCSLAVAYWLIKINKKNLITIIASLFILILVLYEQRLLFSFLSLKYQQYSNLPILADFSSPKERMLWSKGVIVNNDKGMQDHSLKVTLQKGKKYAGFTFKEVYQNWRGYNEIEFRISSSSHQFEKLCLKITDLAHDNGNQAYNNRFNYCPKLSYGENVINITLDDIINAPNNRKMNITEISQIGFFMVDLQAAKTLHINEIKLK